MQSSMQSKRKHHKKISDENISIIIVDRLFYIAEK